MITTKRYNNVTHIHNNIDLLILENTAKNKSKRKKNI